MSEKDDDVKVPKLSDVSSRPARSYKLNRQTRVEAIRDYIKANPNKILRISDLSKATGMSNAAYYLYEMMNEGHVKRHKVSTGAKGHQYSYTWVDEPQPDSPKSIKMSDDDIESLQLLLIEWQNNALDSEADPAELGLQQLGATKFVRWVTENAVARAE